MRKYSQVCAGIDSGSGRISMPSVDLSALENRLKMAQGESMRADIHMDRALTRLGPPRSETRTLARALWLKPVCMSRASARRMTPALWSATSSRDMKK